MAVKWAVRDGNWSNPNTWNDTRLPQPDDDVYADGKTVTIDLDIAVLSLRTTARSDGIAGGRFRVNQPRRIICTGAGIIAGPSSCLVLASGNYNVVINSTITGGRTSYSYGIYSASTGTIVIIGDVSGGDASHAYGVYNASGGTITITGNVIGGGNTSAYGVYNASTGTIAITGNVIGGDASDSCAAYNMWSGTIAITGNVTGGTGSHACGVYNLSSGTITITGNVIGGSAGYAYGVYNASDGIVSITGNVIGGTITSGAYNNTNGVMMISGQAHCSPTGMAPVIANNGNVFLNNNVIHAQDTAIPSIPSAHIL